MGYQWHATLLCSSNWDSGRLLKWGDSDHFGEGKELDTNMRDSQYKVTPQKGLKKGNQIRELGGGSGVNQMSEVNKN